MHRKIVYEYQAQSWLRMMHTRLEDTRVQIMNSYRDQ